MWTGISEAFGHIAPVSVARHWIFACWLALTVAAAVGGWFSGRSWIVVEKPPAEETMSPLSRRNEAVLAVDSPKGQWTRRVKQAAPADFPGLLEEWKSLFPDVRDGIESQQENSLRWLLAQWLVNDRVGFVKAVSDKDFKSPHQAALVIARLNPEMIDALRLLRPEMDGDASWQRDAGANLISHICNSYSAESCLNTAKLRAADGNAGRDGEIFKSLAERSAAMDPDKAEAALDSLPVAARGVFAAEIVKQLPPEDVGRRLALLDRLTPAQWDRDLGQSLGKHGADYADAIFKLPAGTASEAHESFMAEWVANDPEAALHWFASLPQNEAHGPAALGFFDGWASFDSSAAIAWAESLANGPVRQAIASSVTMWLAENSPREAWRWAASIADPEARAVAYEEINRIHSDGAPAEFNKEWQAAIRAAGME
jgi:hypothetical protein